MTKPPTGSPGRILIVDDEKNISFVIEAFLAKAGFETVVFNDSAAALRALDDEEDFSAVVTDLYMPGPGGMEILDFCQKNRPELPVVVVTAYGTVEAAVAALKRGAFDFVTKPFDQTDLLNVVKKAASTFTERLKEPVAIPQVTPAAPGAISSMIGKSTPIQEVFKVISKIAASPSTVLIHGESGTGKELVAFEIHRNSPRANKAFIKINCAAIPAPLIESELFGHEKGSFTGAVTSKPGRFELANEGTLFLDEVAEMPLEMQVKLLRALQEQEFERVGGVNTIQVDVRIITATNRNLEEEVKAGRFREDLYYRLNVVPIHLPALRERVSDIEELAQTFVRQFNQKLGKRVSSISRGTLAALQAYPWPGNIRQLENAIERMVLMSEGDQLVYEDLPEEVAQSSIARAAYEENETAEQAGPSSFKDIVRRRTQSVEKELIEKALQETSGNVTRAAEKLGLSRKGLQLKMKELGVRRREEV